MFEQASQYVFEGTVIEPQVQTEEYSSVALQSAFDHMGKWHAEQMSSVTNERDRAQAKAKQLESDCTRLRSERDRLSTQVTLTELDCDRLRRDRGQLRLDLANLKEQSSTQIDELKRQLEETKLQCGALVEYKQKYENMAMQLASVRKELASIKGGEYRRKRKAEALATGKSSANETLPLAFKLTHLHTITVSIPAGTPRARKKPRLETQETCTVRVYIGSDSCPEYLKLWFSAYDIRQGSGLASPKGGFASFEDGREKGTTLETGLVLSILGLNRYVKGSVSDIKNVIITACLDYAKQRAT